MEQQYIFIIIVAVVCIMIELRARSAREATAKQAHAMVIKLRSQGIRAGICPRCKGNGRHGAITRRCELCGGIGYIYKIPEDDSESDE